MPLTLVSQLIAAAKEEADKENDPHIGDAEWNRLVSEGYRALWNTIRSLNPDFFVTKTATTVAAAANNFLAATLVNRRLRSLWYVTGSSPDDYQRVRRWNMEEPAFERVYKIIGSTVYIYPASTSVGSYSLWSETAFVDLFTTTTIDSRLNDWSEYIYLYAAIAAKDKEESDSTVLVQRLQRLEGEIRSLITDLDTSEPARVVDVSPRRTWRVPTLPEP